MVFETGINLIVVFFDLFRIILITAEMRSNNKKRIFRLIVSEEKSIFFIDCLKKWSWIKMTGFENRYSVTWYW